MPLKAIAKETLPMVSVIIPVRNEKAHIKACLKSALAQEEVAGGFEIIVVDGRSTDGTREIIQKEFAGDSRVRVLDNPRGIVPTALNIGICAARGEIIARMDAHSEYASDYLKQCLQILKEIGADNVGGPARTKTQSYLQKAIAKAYHSFFAVGGARFHDVNYEGYVDTITYGCWYRDTLFKIGLFDEELVRNQDDELNLRLIRAGGKIWQSTRIKSWYHPRSSLQGLFWQYLQYGYWKVRVIQKHRLPAAWRHLAPGLFIFFALVNLILLPWVTWAPSLLLAQIGIYCLASMTAAFNTAKKEGWKLFPIMPLVFACFHFGYGLGFLKGLMDFFILRRSPSRKMEVLTR